MATGERGALTPLGEHKGFGMALASEILGGVATGGPTIAPHHETVGGAWVGGLVGGWVSVRGGTTSKIHTHSKSHS